MNISLFDLLQTTRTFLGVSTLTRDTEVNSRYRELLQTGDLLVDALRLEVEMSKLDLTVASDAAIAEWKDRRRAIECLCEDYQTAMTRWRVEVAAEAVRVEVTKGVPQRALTRAAN